VAIRSSLSLGIKNSAFDLNYLISLSVNSILSIEDSLPLNHLSLLLISFFDKLNLSLEKSIENLENKGNYLKFCSGIPITERVDGYEGACI
jgi:hypothetical protein